ncbi:NADPH:quinone reductase-like Zn-dependent oxidoreductase [Actinoplanes lutulentus]|uniref:NADPH:quinone reductase-like Zn-dependent oxidoreductase n=1 Tax=Actinoplanes lutulentus TaxID=1287878 RepID=A0A327Z5C3_9ACTN|nr:zinc-binding alcohol dehydrogenase family protein [Actinoplanes lutulentus]MBB2948336.1 NADPH:quinone reductase-like Zn-dependent oxidoreductase [Actinoplanes lutulentus]RAK30368.1 NADPH:quinone reductase-like Zn-dependent oxidoreductase [Actinoplanes lutulentus]
MIDAAVLRVCGQPPTIARRPVPVPADDEVLVQVVAAPITPLDVLCASGASYFGAPATPYVPGVQGVGCLPDGTAVWFATSAGMRPGDGSMASIVAVRSDDVVPLPPGAPLELIAALGLSAVAALSALRAGAGSSALSTPGGDGGLGQVVVLGAGGVVGQAAIQLALLGGARRVIAVTRSPASLARAAALGAAATVPLLPDDSETGLADCLRDAAEGPVDLVIDPVFGMPAAAALRVLRPGGTLVNLGSAAGATAPFDSATLRSGSLRIVGYTNNALTTLERASALTEIAAHATAGALTVTHEVVPLAAVAEAWTRQAIGKAYGRMVLSIVDR